MNLELLGALIGLCYVIACLSGVISMLCANSRFNCIKAVSWIPAILGILFIVLYPTIHVLAGGKLPPI